MVRRCNDRTFLLDVNGVEKTQTTSRQLTRNRQTTHHLPSEPSPPSSSSPAMSGHEPVSAPVPASSSNQPFPVTQEQSTTPDRESLTVTVLSTPPHPPRFIPSAQRSSLCHLEHTLSINLATCTLQNRRLNRFNLNCLYYYIFAFEESSV